MERALEDGRLAIAWLARGTLHLVRSEDRGWLLALTGTRGVASSTRRLRDLGVGASAADRGVAAVEDALGDGAPLTRAQLAGALAEAGVRAEGQALAHLLRLGGLRGIAVLGPIVDGAPAFVAATPPEPLAGAARDRALAELARRYLVGHGPAAAEDLARWSGLSLRDARAGLQAIADELAPAGRELVDLASRGAPPRRIPPRLLGAFDPYLLGWADRGFAVPAALATRVHPGGGIVRATATVDGRVVGTWSGRGELDLAGHVAPRERAALGRDAADVARFLG